MSGAEVQGYEDHGFSFLNFFNIKTLIKPLLVILDCFNLVNILSETMAPCLGKFEPRTAQRRRFFVHQTSRQCDIAGRGFPKLAKFETTSGTEIICFLHCATINTCVVQFQD